MSQTENIKDVHTQKGRSDLYKPKGRWRGNEPYRYLLPSSWAIRNLSVALLHSYPLFPKDKLAKSFKFFNFFKNNLVGSLCIKDAQIFV